jgi:hypothetical protein
MAPRSARKFLDSFLGRLLHNLHSNATAKKIFKEIKLSIESEFFQMNEAAAETLSQALIPHSEAIREFVALPNRGIEHLIWLVAHVILWRKLAELNRDEFNLDIDLDFLCHKVRQVWAQNERREIFPDESTEKCYRSIIEQSLNIDLLT